MKDPRRWDVMVRLIQDNDFTSFVEVGVKEGRTTTRVLQKCPKVHVYACDLWANRPEQEGKECGETYKGWHWGGIKREFWGSVSPYKSRLDFHRVSSTALAEIIPEVDLVFLDAAHDYESVMDDITAFWPKVRPGGILSGHDWQKSFPTVIRAVKDSFEEDAINLETDSVWWVRKEPSHSST